MLDQTLDNIPDKVDISVVIPLLNEAESLPELCERINISLTNADLSHEILLIDDGSTDDSWAVIDKLSAQNQAIKGIRFRRNYGKAAALHTGFQATQGEIVITADADLQDRPEEFAEMAQMLRNQGFDLVSGWKKKRYDPISKTLPTKLFNAATRKFSGIPLHDFNCGLKAYRSEVVKSIEVYGEMHRYIPVIAKSSGFKKIGEKVVIHAERKFGEGKYFGAERFINGFLDLLSITFVSRFKKKPMHFFGLLGTLSFLFGGAVTFWLTFEKFYLSNFGNPDQIQREVTEQPLFFIALTTVIIGVQFFLAGFLGELVSLNSPKRNDYQIRETINIDEDFS